MTIPYQIRAFASMFLNRAHKASRYYGTLQKEISNQIFVDGHRYIAYYLSAYALFQIESFLRKNQISKIYRPFKYHLLGILRMEIGGITVPRMNSNDLEKYCNSLKDILWDESKSLDSFHNSCLILDKILETDHDRDRAKDSAIQDKAKKIIEDSSTIEAVK